MNKYKHGDIIKVISNDATINNDATMRKPPIGLVAKLLTPDLSKISNYRKKPDVEMPGLLFGPGGCRHLVHDWHLERVTDKRLLFAFHMSGPFIDDPEFDTELYILQYSITYGHV